MVKLVTSEAEFRDIINNNEFVVVDFFAEWCGPCRMIAPMIEKLDDSTPNVVFIKIDIEQLEDISKEFGVTAMPTFRFFKNGNSGGDDVVIGADIKKITEKLATFIA
ncbi:thioredoxin-like protein [Syncephalis fuscata]|nr:thioredoxin-like protein [Syncephalis fuscata]